MPGFVGVASDLVEYDPCYTNIVARLLGTVVIAEDFDRALAMAKRYHYKLKIVTLDGQVLNPGGSMTGRQPQSGCGYPVPCGRAGTALPAAQNPG